eukprot:TRINITY_DN4146_c0_g1_i1.p1 TRINITY_DN4146_c0_g1~~TRINITY_DN4146_c0_g1_i1.p1  ORF type:complete len:443 (+),score=78.58 TRINITY_DN4146_c0_g1_i1:126-1331(+)
MEGAEVGLMLACIVFFLAACYVTYLMWKGAKWKGTAIKDKDREDFETRELKVSHNYYMGIWLRLVEGSKTGSYDVYKLMLNKDQTDALAKEVKSPWCRTYRPAQQIFSDSGSAAVRTMIMGQHSTLYRQKGFRRCSTLYVSTKEMLFHHLGVNPYSKNTKVQMFTYVLLPCAEFRFSSTSKNLLRDGLSKHAVHANCAEEVIYAGEFNFMDGCLFIDNASGTFSPDKNHLPVVRDFLAQHFKGLPVGYLDFKAREQFFDDLKAGKGFGDYNRYHESVIVAEVLDPEDRKVRMDSIKSEKRKTRELESMKLGSSNFGTTSKKPDSQKQATFSSPNELDIPLIEMSPSKPPPDVPPPEHTAIVIPAQPIGASMPLDRSTPKWVDVQETYEAFVYHAFSDDGTE